jgi:hypothetical protein
MSTNDELKNKTANGTKPVLCEGLNDQTTTEIERLIWDILDKYQVNPMQQPNLTIEILKTCEAYLQRQQPCT